MTAHAHDAKCDCSRASDDSNVNLNEHERSCAKVIAWEKYKAGAFIIDERRVLCGVHSQPFRARWPLGYTVFAVQIVRLITAQAKIWDEALKLARPASCTTDAPCANCAQLENNPLCLMSSTMDPGPYRLGIKAIEAVLDVRPACCRVTANQLYEVYRETRVGVKGRCRLCGSMKTWGTPIHATNHGPLKHVCFVCISTASSTPQNVS